MTPLCVASGELAHIGHSDSVDAVKRTFSCLYICVSYV